MLSREIELYERGGDLVLYRADGTRALPEKAADLIEEFTHWQQHATGQPSPEVVKAVAAHPDFRAVERALKPAYGTDQRRLVNEMGAKLAAGKFSDLGVSQEVGLKLLGHYYSNGAETCSLLK
jgi:hypothetical protein